MANTIEIITRITGADEVTSKIKGIGGAISNVAGGGKSFASSFSSSLSHAGRSVIDFSNGLVHGFGSVLKEELKLGGSINDFARNTIGGLHNQIDKTIKGIFSWKGALTALLAIYAAKRVIEDWIQSADRQARAVAGLETAMRSMGRYSPELSTSLQKLAGGMQKITNFGDEAVVEGQKFLVTYKGIGDELLGRSSLAMADIAALMGGDVTKAANMLGKASMGLTGELRRVGITVDDNTFKTQGYAGVLTQIEAQVKGQAVAMREAGGPWLALANAIDDVKERLGTLSNMILGPAGKALIEVMEHAEAALGSYTDRWRKDGDEIATIGTKIAFYVVKGLQSIIRFTGGAIEIAIGLKRAFEWTYRGIVQIVGWISEAIARVAGIMAKVTQGVAEMTPQFLRPLKELNQGFAESAANIAAEAKITAQAARAIYADSKKEAADLANIQGRVMSATNAAADSLQDMVNQLEKGGLQSRQATLSINNLVKATADAGKFQGSLANGVGKTKKAVDDLSIAVNPRLVKAFRFLKDSGEDAKDKIKRSFSLMENDAEDTTRTMTRSFKNFSLESSRHVWNLAGETNEAFDWAEQEIKDSQDRVDKARIKSDNAITKHILENQRRISDGFADAFSDVLLRGKDFEQSMKDLFISFAEEAIRQIMRIVVAWVLFGKTTASSPFGGGGTGGGGGILGWFKDLFSGGGGIFGGGEGTAGGAAGGGIGAGLGAIAIAIGSVLAFLGGMKIAAGGDLEDVLLGAFIGGPMAAFGWVFSEKAKHFFSSLFESVIDFAKSAWDKIADFAKSAWDSISGFVKSVFSGIGDFVKGIFGGLIGIITGAFDFFKHIASSIWSGIADFAKGALGGVMDFAKGIFSGIGDFAKGIFGGIFGFAKDIFYGIGNFIKGIFSGIGDFAKGIFGGITGIAQGAWNSIVDIAKGAWDTISNLFGNVIGSIGNIVGGIPAIGGGIIGGIIDFGSNIIGDVGKTISKGLKSIGKAIGFATGGEFITSGPRLIEVGEYGPEKITIKPLSGEALQDNKVASYREFQPIERPITFQFNGLTIMDEVSMRKFARMIYERMRQEGLRHA